MTMDATAATAHLNAYCPTTEDPTLSEEQISALLSRAVVIDADGNLPEDDGWTPTYGRQELWRSIADGWRMKAAAVVTRFGFGADGQRFERQQIHAHCLKMERLYRKRVNTSVEHNPRIDYGAYFT